MAPATFSDRLYNSIREKNSVLCVGLDPRWELLPLDLRNSCHGLGLEKIARSYSNFCSEVIDIVAPYVPVVKPQSAFFEACGAAGILALGAVIDHARSKGLLVILDAKRGDISTTGEAYAKTAFTGADYEGQHYSLFAADSLTVNPYLGEDSLEPFLTEAEKVQGGIFVLLRTSNPGSGLFQNLICEGKPLYYHVADAISRWNYVTIRSHGYGSIGAVVGATNPRDLKELRSYMPGVWFLVPGYGAQGGTAEDVRESFDDNGFGAIVNSSRGITFCFKPDSKDWKAAIRLAVEKTNQQLNAVRSR
ncbi:orotidine-5'-phosphate decarboxylase [Telmatocola sphagniphila]|uniref:Orotidine 5'-phosphate decarboxylase n=1 Tax=Telmatocola sphagniphila TaxID=1123043 RepID=A0A8E6EU63_9BACT|nr:orotidine-5'-phosphate decarboxylase [Telmatocola sphagniphila]QVL33319.1 orotidine-5'-phosphate decarboxylase [Telmatocola sphagniphila]